MRRHPHPGRCAVALAAGLTGSGLAAQQFVRTAHPQDTLQNNSGNLSPLGVFATGQAAEARSQILFRPLELPAPGAQLAAIEVHAQGTSTLLYSSLVVRVSPTLAGALVPVFAANLPAPVTVLQAQNLTVPYSAAGWTTIPMTTPFAYVHDGQSALVLEITKVISPNTIAATVMDTPSPPSRTDRPPMVYAFGGIGSGASNSLLATASGDPLAVRLVWTGVPTMSHRSDPGPSGNQYALGSTITYTVEGEPGSFYITTIDTALLPVPLQLPGISGLVYAFSGFTNFGNLDAAGRAVNTVTIPPLQTFVGLYVVYQAGVLNAVTGVGQLTNAHDHFVNP